MIAAVHDPGNARGVFGRRWIRDCSRSKTLGVSSSPGRKGMRNVSVGRLWRSLYLLYFSQPAAERSLYRAARGKSVHSIVEIGIDLAGRTQRLVEVASWRLNGAPLRYTGIDLFEARAIDQPRLPLKQAFAALKRPQVNVELVPGDPAAALRRVANSHAGTDLLLVSASQDGDSLAAAWMWMPRMLTPSSLVFVEHRPAASDAPEWRQLKLTDIQRLAADACKSARRAA